MKLSAKDFKLSIAELASSFRRVIESDCDGFASDHQARAERVRQALAADGYQFFVNTYFPHYVRTPEPSLMHQYLFRRLPAIVNDQRGRWLAMAAPRGEAKSTMVSQLFVLWCIVRGIKHYIPIVMDAQEQAATMLEAIKAELETNPRLAMDFPQVCGVGRVWQVGTIVTANDVKVQAFGSGKRMRGMRHGPYRPDLVILDDIENDENVRSPEQRNKLESWLTKAVLKLGPPDGSMDVIYIGTILHYDSVLSRTLKKPLWEVARFKAVLAMPGNMALWDRWEEVLRNEGAEAAALFYKQHKRQMDAGAVVSWPTARPLYELMKTRADDHEAFDSELQNDPIDAASALFGAFTYWVDWKDDWVYYGTCDPSLGKNGTGRDPSALLVGGFDRQSGELFVVDASIRRRVPDRIISDIIDLQRRYHCLRWGIETVLFQAFLKDELVKRSAIAGVPVPAQALLPNADKALRIESIQPHVANGLIKFRAEQTTLLDQLRHFPKAAHDDGPDALQMLWMLVHSAKSFAVPKTAPRRSMRAGRYGWTLNG